MCQAYEAEANYVAATEKEAIYVAYEKHVSGESPLTDEQLKDMVVRILMLRDAGW